MVDVTSPPPLFQLHVWTQKHMNGGRKLLASQTSKPRCFEQRIPSNPTLNYTKTIGG